VRPAVWAACTKIVPTKPNNEERPAVRAALFLWVNDKRSEVANEVEPLLQRRTAMREAFSRISRGAAMRGYAIFTRGKTIAPAEMKIYKDNL
jgi:hypothetical protein